MGKIIPLDLRLKIVNDHLNGKSLKAISEELPYSYHGIYKIWSLYRKHGKSGLAPKYSNCGRKPKYTEIRQLINSLKDGQQGAPYIRSVLLEQYPTLEIPHERTIQRWWRLEGVTKPRGRKPKKDHSWTNIPHDTWQIDGKEHVYLNTKDQVCWVNIADEGTSSLLQSNVFPL